MIDVKAYLEDKIKALTVQAEQVRSQLDAIAGARQAFQMTLDEMNKPVEVPSETDL